ACAAYGRSRLDRAWRLISTLSFRVKTASSEKSNTDWDQARSKAVPTKDRLYLGGIDEAAVDLPSRGVSLAGLTIPLSNSHCNRIRSRIVFDPRLTLTTRSPACLNNRRNSLNVSLAVGCPSTATIVSSSCTPTAAAGLSAAT